MFVDAWEAYPSIPTIGFRVSGLCMITTKNIMKRKRHDRKFDFSLPGIKIRPKNNNNHAAAIRKEIGTGNACFLS